LPNKPIDDDPIESDEIETDEIDIGSLRSFGAGADRTEDLDDPVESDEIDIGSLRSFGAGADRAKELVDLTGDWDDLLPEDEDLLFEISRKEEISNFVGQDPEEYGPHRSPELGSTGRIDRESTFFPMQALLTLEAQIEAVIFASPKSVKVGDILEVIGGEDVGTREVQEAINNLLVFYEERGGGFKLEHVRGGGYQFRTAPAAAPLMEKIFSSRPRPLSRAAQETLAIVAYRQPATRADIEFIRGVDAGSIIKNLLERELIKCVGRKEDSGRPMVFGTTDEFLRVYQIDSLKDLPPLDSFQPSQDTLHAASAKLEDSEDSDVDVEDFIEDRDDLDDDDDLGLSLRKPEDSDVLQVFTSTLLVEEELSVSAAAEADNASVLNSIFESLPSDELEPIS
jgi:segregation and condensation protein B